MRRATAAALLVVAVVGLGACRDVKDTNSSTPSSTAVRVTGSITVSAASSLTDVFTTIGERFMRDNPGTTVTFNFGSSTALATQIRNGAPVDTFVAADLTTMERLGADGFVGSPTSIAANRLVIVTEPGDPRGVRSLADLPDAGIVALCAAEAPCGMYAGQVLARAGVMIPESSVTRGVDARATIGAVTRGDADAAIVYATDARAAGDAVATVQIRRAQNVRAIYQMASVRRAGEPTVSSAFIAYTLSPAGRAVLRRAGFITAP